MAYYIIFSHDLVKFRKVGFLLKLSKTYLMSKVSVSYESVKLSRYLELYVFFDEV